MVHMTPPRHELERGCDPVLLLSPLDHSFCTQLCCVFAIYLFILRESICFTSSHLGVSEGEDTI